MKVIFIDIDGPLAWGAWDGGRVKIAEGTWNELTIPYPWVQEDCNALIEIIEKTNANLVVSSDWRLHYGFGQLKLIFEHYGINRHYIIDIIPFYNPNRKLSSSHDWDRACQINTWVKSFKPKNWISIDDMPLNISYKRLHIPQWRHVQVDDDFGYGGKLRDKIDECVKKLNKQL